MFEVLRGYEPLVDAAGTVFRPRTYGRIEGDGGWSGWLVFFPVPPGRVISSGRETTQPTYDDLVLWAATLTPVYLEGALQRALTLQPEAELIDDLARLYAMATDAEDVAELAKASARVHELAADVDRIRAEEAERRASDLEATAASVEEAGATVIAEEHEVAARSARQQAARARRRKRMAKADAPAAATRPGAAARKPR